MQATPSGAPDGWHWADDTWEGWLPTPAFAPSDALDRDIVFRFFWFFSVFECALKRGLNRTGFTGGSIL
jgi:hypothetical protein